MSSMRHTTVITIAIGSTITVIANITAALMLQSKKMIMKINPNISAVLFALGSTSNSELS